MYADLREGIDGPANPTYCDVTFCWHHFISHVLRAVLQVFLYTLLSWALYIMRLQTDLRKLATSNSSVQTQLGGSSHFNSCILVIMVPLTGHPSMQAACRVVHCHALRVTLAVTRLH